MVSTPIKKQEQARIPNSHYVKAEDKPAEETKPVAPATPEQPAAK
jgi:hypothetical protein